MNFVRFSKKELSDILETIEAAAGCASAVDFGRVLDRASALIEADNCVCGLVKMDSGKGARPLGLVNRGHPAGWLNAYMAERLYRSDPVLRYIFERKKAHNWKEAFEAFPGDSCDAFTRRLSDFELTSGIASGLVTAASDKVSIISFAGDRDRFREREKSILDILTPHLHEAISRVSKAESIRSGPLSSREIEVLKWIKDGKTNWEVSVILDVSERTVKFHLNNIMAKLEASNRTHAVAKAVWKGLLD